jgi:hypothetical protein
MGEWHTAVACCMSAYARFATARAYLVPSILPMGSKKPARIPLPYRILAIALALLFIGWMMFVYKPGAPPL